MKSDLLKTVLTIAGSDPSGGAGIQADIKTFTTVGVYCGAVITAVTCQNTRGVGYFSSLSPTLVKDQINSVLTDLNVSHIKIGMLGSAEIAESVRQCLNDYEGEIIFDPVRAAGSGDPLYHGRGQEGLGAEMEGIVRLATVITPNLDELAALSKTACPDSETALQAAGQLLTEFPGLRAVCLTGGHLNEAPEMVTDFLVNRADSEYGGESSSDEPSVHLNSHPFIKSSNLHGTGCTFSSAFTAYHLLSGDDRTAFTRASEFTARLIEKSAPYSIGRGNGPLLHSLFNSS
ncbi:MAG: bifunctional hydroxymethylpyrimidine kinase/phosphomethylpyrimidine kinase [Desulfurivibrionaceae bacterium]